MSAKEMAAALARPRISERWSPLAGSPAVILDGAPADVLASDLQGLAWLPAVTIGVASSLPEAVADAVDVRVETRDQAEAVAAAVQANPLASVTLVQLLRRTGEMPPQHAILAESQAYSTLQAGPEFSAWQKTYTRKASMPSREPAVRLDREGPRLLMTFNRPEKRNAFSAELRDALCEALALVHEDDEIESVIWTGAGPAFCSGGDLDEFGSFPDPATAHAIRATRNVGILLIGCAGRVRPHLHGACVGAGIELPAFCRHVVAAPDAFFVLPEVAMGLVPGAGGTASLPRRIGRQRTAWMALTGERVSAEVALAWGLVDEILPR